MNTTLKLQEGSIFIEAKVGAFGNKAVALAGAWFVSWPLAVTAAIGMITQSKLDEEMVNEVEKAVYKYEQKEKPLLQHGKARFCTNCGAEIPENAAFCPGCGQKV